MLAWARCWHVRVAQLGRRSLASVDKWITWRWRSGRWRSGARLDFRQTPTVGLYWLRHNWGNLQVERLDTCRKLAGSSCLIWLLPSSLNIQPSLARWRMKDMFCLTQAWRSHHSPLSNSKVVHHRESGSAAKPHVWDGAVISCQPL